METFGKHLGVSRDVINNIELNRLARPEQKDPLYKLICKEFSVSEEWLRTGAGDWKARLPEKDEIASIVYGILQPNTKNDCFYNTILSIVDTYQKLSPQSQEVIREFINQSLENIKKREG